MRKLCLILAMLALSTPALAQPKSDPTTTILQKLVADAQAALADANQNQDKIASSCYQAIIDVGNAKLAAAQTAGGGVLLAFQKVRDVTKLNSSPIGTALIIGCAPLVQDAKVNMIQFFANIGASVLLKGILIP